MALTFTFMCRFIGHTQLVLSANRSKSKFQSITFSRNFMCTGNINFKIVLIYVHVLLLHTYYIYIYVRFCIFFYIYNITFN